MKTLNRSNKCSVQTVRLIVLSETSKTLVCCDKAAYEFNVQNKPLNLTKYEQKHKDKYRNVDTNSY